MRNPIEEILETAILGTKFTADSISPHLEIIVRALNANCSITFLGTEGHVDLICALIEHNYVGLENDIQETELGMKVRYFLTERGKCLAHNLESGLYD